MFSDTHNTISMHFGMFSQYWLAYVFVWQISKPASRFANVSYMLFLLCCVLLYNYTYLHVFVHTRIILLVCIFVRFQIIGLPMYLSGKLASLLASSLTLATCYFCCVVSSYTTIHICMYSFTHALHYVYVS